MTTIIGFLGGPCIGKTTTGLGLSYYLKTMGRDVIYVPERAKELFYDGHDLLPKQREIFDEQLQRESRYHGKVEYVVTDSPIVLNAIYCSLAYEQFLISEGVLNYITSSIKNELNYRVSNNIIQKYYTFRRNKEYNPLGREQTEKEAIDIDSSINLLFEGKIKHFEFVKDYNHLLEHLDVSDQGRIPHLFSSLFSNNIKT